MTIEEIFLSNLDKIDRAARFVARRAHLSPEDTEDLVADVRYRFMQNDYEVLRNFRGNCALSTYAASIAHCIHADHRMHVLGRWRPSAEANRLGPGAIALEKAIQRDHLSFAEAFSIVTSKHPMTREQAEAIVDRLPQRAERAHFIEQGEEADAAASDETAEEAVLAHESGQRVMQLNEVMQGKLAQFPEEDRVAYKLLAEGTSVADIARMLERDQKKLYRRLETMHRWTRDALIAAGFSAADVRDLIGRADSKFDFGLRDPEIASPRQTMDPRGKGNHEVHE
jgi:hypothetical protein